MAFSESSFAATAETIAAAPFAPETWPRALALLAAAGGGWAGQLIGVSPRAGAAFNWVHGLPVDALEDFERHGGTDIAVNPRIGAIIGAPAMRPTGEREFIDEETRRRNPFYQDFLRRYDDSFCCFARLHDHRGVSVVAAVLRSERQGHIDGVAREAFAALLPHLDAAVRLQATLEGQGAAAAAGALDALSIQAFVCDPFGRVVATTAAGDAVAREGRHLRVVLGRLKATDSASDFRLQAALRIAAMPSPPGRRSPIGAVLLRSATDGAVVADVAPLPTRSFGLRLGAVTIVAMAQRRHREHPSALLNQAFGFTAAEAAVALAICRGERPTEIAMQRQVSVETVRNQLKSVFAKAGADSQAALGRLVAGLVGE